MTTLSEVLGAMLRDVNDAQAYSTRAARELAAEWQDDPRLLPLDVPNAWISELDLELRFAIAGVDRQPARRRDPAISRATFTHAADHIAAAATHAVATYVRERLDLAGDRPRWESMIAAIEHPERRARLRDQLEDALFGARSSIVTGTPPAVDINVATCVVDETLAEKLFGEAPLATVFTAGSKARTQTQKQLAGVIDTSLTAINAALAASQAPGAFDPDLDVLVSSQDLAEVPAHLVSTLRIQLDMRKYRWLDDTLLIEQK